MRWIRRQLRPGGRSLPWFLVTVGLMTRTLQLRGRAGALTALPSRSGDGPAGDDFELVAVDGARVEPETLAAAVAMATEQGLAVLELVPDDVDAERALDLLRAVDPSTYREDRLARGQGTAHALVVSRRALARAGGRPEDPVREADLVTLLAEAKRCAPGATDVVVARGVHAASPTPRRRRGELRATHQGMVGVAVASPFLGFAFLGLGFVLAPVWAFAALVAWCAQPVLALRGTVLAGARTLRTVDRPRGTLRRAVAVLRADEDAVSTGPSALGGSTASIEDDPSLDPGPAEVARFFEAPRTTCPWCASTAIDHLLTCTDVLQAKPGTFRLDRCEGCGHVFQNPRLSLEGLDFYYRDFYDGAGEDQLAGVFESSPRPYLGRAELARRHLPTGDPATWLDVGTGHAHFCLMAAQVFPGTRFEALDLSDAIDVAERRGWVAAAHRGLFPDLADDLVARFDVVSMHHYLEHTREPAEELKAARRVLRPGGHLLIEVPDPECRAGRVLGRWWGPWFQPQHQHLIPMGNLCRALEDEGFEVVATEREEVHQPVELAMATWMVLNHLGPPTGAPWQAPSTRAALARRWAVFLAGAPVLAGALLVDKVSGPVVARAPGGPNGYRVLARLR